MEEKDYFKSWLKENPDHYALTDKSYKNFYQRYKRKQYVGEINTELATYGDAVLKLALSEILFEREGNLSVEKADYESDEALTKYIAKHYGFLSILRFDKDNDSMPQDYDHKGNKDRNNHKYLATAVEACLGAIYRKDKDMNKIIEIVKGWKDIIDNAKKHD